MTNKGKKEGRGVALSAVAHTHHMPIFVSRLVTTVCMDPIHWQGPGEESGGNVKASRVRPGKMLGWQACSLAPTLGSLDYTTHWFAASFSTRDIHHPLFLVLDLTHHFVTSDSITLVPRSFFLLCPFSQLPWSWLSA